MEYIPPSHLHLFLILQSTLNILNNFLVSCKRPEKIQNIERWTYEEFEKLEKSPIRVKRGLFLKSDNMSFN